MKLVNHGTPTELTAAQRRHLEHLFGPRLAEIMSDRELELEVADVIEEGRIVYQLYAWNNGSGYLIVHDSLECVAWTTQYDMERWTLDQRPLFSAMARALREADPRLRQPLVFAEADDPLWDELIDKTPGELVAEADARRAFWLKL